MKITMTSGEVRDGKRFDRDVCLVGGRYIHTYEEGGIVYQDPGRQEPIVEICFGFMTGNFADIVDAKATAAKYATALREAFPGAVVGVDYQRGSGSLPSDLKPHILIDGEPAHTESAGDTIKCVIESVEPVYA
jgi:hypothetical protein